MSNVFEKLAAANPSAIHNLGEDPAKWAQKAHLDYEILESPVAFSVDGKVGRFFNGKRALYRSDTEDALAIVGAKFHLVQPREILEFYGEVAQRYGFKLAIAGEINLGRKIWAMAQTPHGFEIGKGDKVQGGFFFVTACDGTLSTQAYFTSIRLYCLNQLPVIHKLSKQGRGINVFRVTHGSKFSMSRVEADLQRMEDGWESFRKANEALANAKVTNTQAVSFFAKHFGGEEAMTVAEVEELKENTVMSRVLKTYRSGEGQEGIKGTAWGLVNAVTRYVDHETRAKDGGVQIRKAWIEKTGFKQLVFTDALSTFVPKFKE